MKKPFQILDKPDNRVCVEIGIVEFPQASPYNPRWPIYVKAPDGRLSAPEARLLATALNRFADHVEASKKGKK